MDPEVKLIMLIAGISIPVGLGIGVLLRKRTPELCKTYTKSCLDRKWWLFLLGVILFTGLSSGSFVTGRPYFGFFFAAFAVLEAFALFFYGFRSITPEMAARIDASDPTLLFPNRKPVSTADKRTN